MGTVYSILYTYKLHDVVRGDGEHPLADGVANPRLQRSATPPWQMLTVGMRELRAEIAYVLCGDGCRLPSPPNALDVERLKTL